MARAAGNLTLRAALLAVTEVDPTPGFTNPGLPVDISARVLSAFNQAQMALASYTITNALGTTVFTSTPVRYDRVVVHSGDTVWSLVSHRSTRSDDLGEAVYRVSQINHLKAGSRLEPGSVLLFPSR